MGTGAAVALGGAAMAFRSGHLGKARTQIDPWTLNRGNKAEPDTLDPHLAQANWEMNIIGDMFSGLMTLDAAANPIFGAAESYSVSEDGLTYRFKLRDHVWSDGVPVTADDYVFSFRRVLDPATASQYAPMLYPIQNAEAVNGRKMPIDQLGVRAIDNRTVEIAFHFQVPYIKELMAHMTTFAVPRHVVEKYGADWMNPAHAVSNGPFILKEWVPNEYVHLVKNPRFYAADDVVLKNVFFYPTQDQSAALKRFRAGEFDVISDGIPPQQIDWLRENMSRELRLYPYILTQYVQFNMHRAPFDDPRVREAMCMAIDREIITAKIMRANEAPAYALVPPGMVGYPGKAQLGFKSMRMASRVEKAKQLLAEAGFGPSRPLSFDYNLQNTTESKIIAVALQEMWREVGAQVRLMQSESQVHYQTLRRRDFAAAWTGWVADYRDAKNYLFLFASSTTDMNFGGYSNAEYDRLMTSSDNERDPAKRQLLLQSAEQVLLADNVIAPVFFGVARDLVSQQVKGWVSNNVNFNRSRYLSLARGKATV
ncbi:MAG TPA: peptide ABC transporter substrate-binding protein [Rhizomicrobium sp.]|jgi:oligopeptide transport system substrate-binding protein|nr:peptide ABC transporter substrate-binding protein [Rhizomicrobium sp.]